VARPCSVCRHAERPAIDSALVSGEPFRDIARRYATSKDALSRHREHLARGLVLAREAENATRADDLLERTRSLERDARRLLAKAEKEGDFRAAIAAVRTALDVVALLHKVAKARDLTDAELRARFLASDEWKRIRDTMVEALRPFPQASEAVGLALAKIGEA
jgi:hypothetical protein